MQHSFRYIHHKAIWKKEGENKKSMATSALCGDAKQFRFMRLNAA